MSKKLIKTVLLTLLIIFGMPGLVHSQENQEKLNRLLENAYSNISTNPIRAIVSFEKVLETDSLNVNVLKQVGYLYIDHKLFAKALDKFLTAEKISPSDTLTLQIAYLLNKVGKKRQSYNYFRRIEKSKFPVIGDKARLGTVVLEPEAFKQNHPWWGNIYAAPYYDTRWQSYFGILQVNEGIYFDRKKRFSLFGALQITGDLKSEAGGGGKTPIIFSDNAAVAGIGLGIKPLRGLTLIGQGGVGYNLIDDGSKSRFKEDFRGLLIYGDGIYAEISTPRNFQISFKPFTDIYSSTGYYSRYKNAINYTSVRGGVRFIEFGKSGVDIYARLNGAIDSENLFYNNLAEWGGGIKIIPHYSFGLNLIAEFERGYFWRKSSHLPDNLFYNSFRFYIIFERSF